VAKREFAPGLPDPRRFGRVTALPLNKPLRFVIQKHLAQRAGPHFDIRFGPDQGHKPTLLSWAARKLPEQPGEKRMAFQQPLHTGAYADFEGEIVSGYGKGTVKTHDKGQIIVTKVTPDKINFAVIHKKHPETFTLVRKSGPPIDPSTAREKRTQGGSWLMINTTPTDVIKHKKVHYAKVPANDIEKLFDEKWLHSEKIDGAAALYRVLADRIEVLSYRPTTTGRPIVHTYRVGGTTNVDIPKHLVGSILRGELYGVRHSTGRAIPPQELGGILNAATAKSLAKQKEQGVDLRSRIFNILRYGKKTVGLEEPLAGRLEKLKEIMQYLPSPKFSLPEMAGSPEEQRALWKRITTGKHPLTHEGIVAWPKAGGKPTKVKLYDEHDVFVREIFPGTGKLEGTGAGGFEYSLEPKGPVVGKVGTGFSEATRKQMWETPDEFKGRIARIKAQGQFPSGAFRAPGLIAFHEDYPAVKAAADSNDDVSSRIAELYEEQGFEGPQTLGDVGMNVGSDLLFFPAAKATYDVGKAIHAGTAAGLGAQAAGRFALPALAGEAAAAYGAWAVPIAAAVEAGMTGYQATKDPEYQAGKIGLARAMGREYQRAAEAQQADTQERLESSPLTGSAVAAYKGISQPVSTFTGLVQALWRVIKMPFTSSEQKQQAAEKLKEITAAQPKAAGVLGPIIKRATEELGGDGDTMGALVKAAVDYAQEAPKLPPHLAKELGIDQNKVSFGDRMRGYITGMDPKDIMATRRGAKSVASLVRKLQEWGLVEA